MGKTNRPISCDNKHSTLAHTNVLVRYLHGSCCCIVYGIYGFQLTFYNSLWWSISWTVVQKSQWSTLKSLRALMLVAPIFVNATLAVDIHWIRYRHIDTTLISSYGLKSIHWECWHTHNIWVRARIRRYWCNKSW